LSVRHHGFSHSSLYKVTSEQAPRNLLIEFQSLTNSFYFNTLQEKAEKSNSCTNITVLFISKCTLRSVGGIIA
jgi:hypothetical protein